MNTTNTKHHSRNRRTLLLSGILLGLAAASLPAQATTIIPDTWYSSGPAGTPASGDGITFNTTTRSGFQSLLTYFGPASLTDVGSSLSVSLKLSGELGTNSATSQYPLGFALYNSGGNQISANNLGQNGNAPGGTSTGDPSPYIAYRGYRIDMNSAARPSQAPMRLVGRSGDNNALASSAAHPTTFGGGDSSGARTLASDTLYSVAYTITRTDADTLAVTFSITGGDLPNGYNGTWSVAASSAGFTTTFDTFAITLSGVNTFNNMTLYDVKIDATHVIPEPATFAALTGIAVLGFALYRRRRR